MLFKQPFVQLAIAVVSVSVVLGQEKVAEKPVPAASDFSKEAYTIERLSTQITMESDGTGTRETKAEIKIIADAGVKAFAVLNFTYTSANEAVEVEYVRVRKPDGSVIKTPDYNIQDMPADITRSAPLYSDIHEKHIAVKGLGVGDTLEYLVRSRVVKPEVPAHFWYEYSFTKRAIAKDEQLELSVPADKYIKIVSPDFKPGITQEGARKIYRWTYANLAVKEKDPNQVPRRIPPNPDVQITTFANWEEIGRWYGGLQDDPVKVTPAIQAKAAELTKGLSTNEEKIHALYNFVSLKYHYIGLDFGIGRYQPHSADDVLDNDYGDCKDKHTLLASLLKAAGIEAWPALIHTTRKLDPGVPSPAQFNHVITVVPNGRQMIWLDTTPEVAPFGLLLLTLRNKQSLVIPADKLPMLMTTPDNPPFPEEQEFSMQGRLAADGTFSGHAEQSYRGDTEVLMRMVFRQVSQSQWKEAVQRFSQSLNFGGDVSNVKMTPPDDIDKPFELSYDYVRKNYGDWDNRQIIAPLPPMGIEIAKGSREVKPLEPILLGALGSITYRGRIELPHGYAAVAPARVSLQEPFAEYTDETRIENGVMTTTRKLVIRKTEVALSDWDAYHKFGRELADDEFNYIRLNRTDASADAGKPSDDEVTDAEDADALVREGTDALQRRDVPKAQALIEKAIAKDPNHKGAHLALGLVMAAQNRFGDAITALHQEEEISPNDPRAYQAAATLIALRGTAGDAIEEWRKLLKADPSNRVASSTLGGILYQRKKYTEAAEVLETALKATPDNADLLYQLGDAYLKSGQTEKGLSHLRAAIEQKDDDPIMLNNVSYSLAESKINLDQARDYGEKSIDELDDEARNAQSSEEVEQRVTYQYSLVWDTLGWVYFQQGDLKRAEPLVRASWLLGEESLVAEHLGTIYEKEGKPREAAHMYELASAVSAVPYSPGNSPADTQREYKNRQDSLTARYEKLMGKKPATDIRRLPNGEWTQTPAEQLRHSREVNLNNEGKLVGAAEFTVVFKPEKAASASFENGDEELRPLVNKLAAAHYPIEFPPDSEATLTLRVDVKCHATGQCVGMLVNPLPPRQTFPSMTAAPAHGSQ